MCVVCDGQAEKIRALLLEYQREVAQHHASAMGTVPEEDRAAVCTAVVLGMVMDLLVAQAGLERALGWVECHMDEQRRRAVFAELASMLSEFEVPPHAM
jgi:hypothetical protein